MEWQTAHLNGNVVIFSMFLMHWKREYKLQTDCCHVLHDKSNGVSMLLCRDNLKENGKIAINSGHDRK